MSSIDESKKFVPLNIAVLTISDTRSLADDKSGTTLSERLTAAGHRLAAREIVVDDVEAIRVIIKKWIAEPDVDAIITTGGTGFTGRDVTPEAIEPLFEKRMDGFSIAFHLLSHAKIGTSTIQSRATAGVAGATFIFCLPRRLGRHSCRPARLPHAALQFCGDHAAPGRTSAPPEGERGVGLNSVIPGRVQRVRAKRGPMNAHPESRDSGFAASRRPGMTKRKNHSSRSQVSPIRLCPKLRCGSVATCTKPASW